MLKVIILFSLIFSLIAKADTGCADYIGTCDYYRCVENSQSCGTEGYYQYFGLHYCEKYQAKAGKYNRSGQEFLSHVRSCLQEKLEQLDVLPSCGQIKKVAIQTHEDCYRENNFCELSIVDQLRIKWMAKREFFDKDFGKFAQFLNDLCYPNSSSNADP